MQSPKPTKGRTSCDRRYLRMSIYVSIFLENILASRGELKIRVNKFRFSHNSKRTFKVVTFSELSPMFANFASSHPWNAGAISAPRSDLAEQGSVPIQLHILYDHPSMLSFLSSRISSYSRKRYQECCTHETIQRIVPSGQ